MKFVKNNLKLIIGFIVGAILAGGIAYAAISASEVSYTTSKNANITNVQEALNDLYKSKKDVVRVYPLYYRGLEESSLSGGWSTEVKSTNSKWVSGYNGYGKNTISGNSSYSSGIITKGTKSVICTTSHNSSDGYGETETILKTNKAIDLKEFTKLYIYLNYSTNNNARYFISFIDENGNVAQNIWSNSIENPSSECEIDLSNLKSKPYYIYIYLTSNFSKSVTGSLEIKSIFLEK